MKNLYFILIVKRAICTVFLLLFLSSIFISGQADNIIKPEFRCLMKAQLPNPIGQLRIVQMNQGKDKKPGFAVMYGEDGNIDPWHEAFFYPNGTLKISVTDADGKVLWTKNLGRGVVTGENFCPMCVFDLDSDGIDEIYYVGNPDDFHPLRISSYRLTRLNGITGEQTGDWKWPYHNSNESMSHTFRNSIRCGYVKGKPVLITIQGLYQTMSFQAYDPGMKLRWERVIPATDPGARGSHMCAISDMNQDGIQEIMYGERCLELDKGTDVFNTDNNKFSGHSDVAQPVWDATARKWYLFCCRENQNNIPPRVCLLDYTGKVVWGHVDDGHIDQGIVARLGDGYRHLAFALKINSKSFEKSGIVRGGQIEYHYDALTGAEVHLPYSLNGMQPVDVNGDGYHELVYQNGNRSVIINRKGEELASFEGKAILVGKLVDLPGEQIVILDQGELKLLTNINANDCAFALERYKNPVYKINLKNTGNKSISGI